MGYGMNKVVVDSALLPKLGNLASRIEFCDVAGRTLGYFVPASEEGDLLYAWARGEFTDDEVNRARGQSGGLSLSEILADLGAT